MIRVSAMGLVAASALAAAVILGWSRPRSITEADEKPAKGRKAAQADEPAPGQAEADIAAALFGGQ